jgi:integrase
MGKRKQKMFLTREQALDWEAKKRKLRRKKNYSEEINITSLILLLDWANWYMDVAKTMFTENTCVEKRDVFKRFFQCRDEKGKKLIDPAQEVHGFQTATAFNYLNIQAEERGGNASNKARKNLLAAWNLAIGFMEGFPKDKNNPFKTPKKPEKRFPRYVPSEKDFWAVYEVSKDWENLFLLTFVCTAGRRMEICRLKTDDLHFDTSEISLWTRKEREGSWREDKLPMIDILYNAMIEHVQNLESEYIFPSPRTGKPYKDPRKILQKLCKQAGVKPFGYHAIRHLVPSILQKLGVEPKVIQAVMRHGKFSTTENYLHRQDSVRAGLTLIQDRMKEKVLPKSTSSITKAKQGAAISS